MELDDKIAKVEAELAALRAQQAQILPVKNKAYRVLMSVDRWKLEEVDYFTRKGATFMLVGHAKIPVNVLDSHKSTSSDPDMSNTALYTKAVYALKAAQNAYRYRRARALFQRDICTGIMQSVDAVLPQIQEAIDKEKRA